MICNCNGVAMGALINCVKGGERTAEAVMAATRAGTAWGSCESMVREITEWAGGGSPVETIDCHCSPSLFANLFTISRVSCRSRSSASTSV